MDTSEEATLLKASELNSAGFPKIAVKLLLEYLQTDPNSSTVLNAIGRAYLQDHQPRKAESYLKLALKIKQKNSAKKKSTDEYQADSFDNDDMAFVESQADDFLGEDFRLEDDEPILPTRTKETQKPPNDRPLLSIGKVKINGRQSEKTENEILVTYRGRRKQTLPNKLSSSPKKNNEHGVHDEVFKTFIPHVGDQSIRAEQTAVNDASASDQQEFSSEETLDSPFLTSPPSIEKPVAKEAVIYDHSINELEAKDSELIESDQLTTDEIFETSEEQNDDLSEGGSFTTSPQSLDEEFSWGDLEDLGEFDDLARQELEDEVQDKGKIKREHRARQVAVEVLDKTDWDTLHLDLLQQIFYENGWSATRAAIEREIDKGLSPDQLTLAWEIKQLWARLSWVDALLVINCFSSFPDVEEVQVFMDDTFHHWHNSGKLRKTYRNFYYYLKCRTGALYQTLPGDCMFSFREPVDTDLHLDSSNWYYSNGPERQELLDLGLKFTQWPGPPEYIGKKYLEVD